VCWDQAGVDRLLASSNCPQNAESIVIVRVCRVERSADKSTKVV
jgi:hypothetical protein